MVRGDVVWVAAMLFVVVFVVDAGGRDPWRSGSSRAGSSGAILRTYGVRRDQERCRASTLRGRVCRAQGGYLSKDSVAGTRTSSEGIRGMGRRMVLSVPGEGRVHVRLCWLTMICLVIARGWLVRH